MRIPAPTLALVLTLALPAAASASTIESEAGVITYRSGADAGDFVLLGSQDPFTHTFLDAGSELRAGTGCVAGPPVMCHGVDLQIRLGRRDDIAKAFGPLDVTAFGGFGDDEIYAGGNHNEVTAGDGDDLAISNSNGGANVFGNDGDDTLYGFGGGTHLVGEEGNDFAVGEATSNELEGGPGFDTLVGVTSSFGTGTLTGGDGFDILATLGDTAGAGWTFAGGAGSDTIVGSPGADTVSAGSGTDLIGVRDGVADTVDCDGGFDVVWADREDVVEPNCEAVLFWPMPRFHHVSRALARAADLKDEVHRVNFRAPGPMFGS